MTAPETTARSSIIPKSSISPPLDTTTPLAVPYWTSSTPPESTVVASTTPPFSVLTVPPELMIVPEVDPYTS